MKVKVYYFINDYDDDIIIEGNNIEEIRKICDEELKKRVATYSGSEILEE